MRYVRWPAERDWNESLVVEYDLDEAEANLRHQIPFNPSATSRQAARPDVRSPKQLRLHRALEELGWAGEIDEVNDAARLANPPVTEPILITTNGIILAGFGRWRLALLAGGHEVHCIEYPLSEDEALQFIINHHQPQRRWNAFIRIRLALTLEPYFQKRALDNMRAGGKYKGLTNLPEAQHIDVRQEIARAAGVDGLAQQLAVHADPAQSHVEFTLGDVLHTVHGTFRLKESTVRVDPSQGKASGVIVVDATSGNTGNDARDHKMHKEILQSDRYPEIRFALQNMEGTLSPSGNSEIKLSGVMSIHGSDHPLTVTVPVQIENSKVTTDVHFVVPYVQWGMKDPSTFVLRVSKEVDITVHLVGSLGVPPAS